MIPRRDDPTTWELYECERGNRWSASLPTFRELPGSVCTFSGCAPDHTIKVIGTTQDREQAFHWFNNKTEGKNKGEKS